MDGVESHAHILDGYLQNRIPREADPILYYTILVFVSLGAVVLYLFLPKYVSPLLALFLMLATIWLGRYLYGVQGLVIDIFPALLGVSVFSFPVTFIYRFFIIDREKRAITSAFAHYVDPTLVSQIAEKS